MKVTWLGHSAVHVQGSKTILVDPFLTGNPAAPYGPEAVESADLILVTHAHEDHLGDAYALCRKTGATLVSSHEIAVQGAENGVAKTEGMNIGGSIEADGVPVHMVHAQHSVHFGDVTGLIFELDGRILYHLGDTGLFGDLKLIAEFFPVIDLAFVPIGDRYTMGPQSAARAVEFLRPRIVVPIHYNTWPPIAQDPHVFKTLVGDTAEVRIPPVGEPFDL